MTNTKPTKRAAARKPATAAASKRARSKPRAAKPRKAKPKAKPRIVRRKLVWRGILIAIQFQPKGQGLFDHLQLQVIAPERAPIPVTDTGYRSHYLYPFFVRDAGGPVAYVRKWLDEEARSPAYRRALDRWRQLDLFDMLKS